MARVHGQSALDGQVVHRGGGPGGLPAEADVLRELQELRHGHAELHAITRIAHGLHVPLGWQLLPPLPAEEHLSCP